MITIEEIRIISHLDCPALSLRVDRGQKSEVLDSDVDTQHVTHIYEFDKLPVTGKKFFETLKWLISRLEKDEI
jgi:hypothetical protein